MLSTCVAVIINLNINEFKERTHPYLSKTPRGTTLPLSINNREKQQIGNRFSLHDNRVGSRIKNSFVFCAQFHVVIIIEDKISGNYTLITNRKENKF